MKLYVDRIEETVAVCQTEDERTVEIQLSVLPSDLKEGNVLVHDENGNFIVDKENEEERRLELFELQNSLFDC